MDILQFAVKEYKDDESRMWNPVEVAKPFCEGLSFEVLLINMQLCNKDIYPGEIKLSKIYYSFSLILVIYEKMTLKKKSSKRKKNQKYQR